MDRFVCFIKGDNVLGPLVDLHISRGKESIVSQFRWKTKRENVIALTVKLVDALIIGISHKDVIVFININTVQRLEEKLFDRPFLGIQDVSSAPQSFGSSLHENLQR